MLDFGLAKPTGAFAGGDADSALPTVAKTAEGVIVGTMNYMSPEQVEGQAIDHRSDIFSVGIIFYEMATGRRPFQGETPTATPLSILKDTPASVTDCQSFTAAASRENPLGTVAVSEVEQVAGGVDGKSASKSSRSPKARVTPSFIARSPLRR